jgi:hypothetical protein
VHLANGSLGDDKELVRVRISLSTNLQGHAIGRRIENDHRSNDGLSIGC